MFSYHESTETDPLLEKEKTKTCLFCFDKCITETSVPSDSKKLFEKCSRYLHCAIVSEISTAEFDELSRKLITPFCEKCLRAAVKLSGLIEKLEFCQKNIIELAFMFSLGILHRRGKFSWNADKISSKSRKVQEFDISSLPDLDNELESETDIGPSYSFLTSHCQQILSSTDEIEIADEDNRDIKFETPFIIESEFESNINPYSNSKYVDDDVQDDNAAKGESNPFPCTTPANGNSNKTVTTSKTEIANSPLPIVSLERLELRNNTTTYGLQTFDNQLNKITVDSDDTTGLSDNDQNEALCGLEISEPNFIICPAPSDIAVNISTMGIKVEALGSFEGEKEEAEKQNLNCGYKEEQDEEEYDPKYDEVENRFICKQCKKGFKSKRMLLLHEKRHNVGKSCSICNKHFSSNQALRNHERVHTGEKPFACSVCNKCFTVKHALTRHQSMHTGEKPYQCNICKKRFPFRSGLFAHRSVHSNDRPFQCLVCEKRFSLKQSLLTHLKTHSNNPKKKKTKKLGQKPRLDTHSIGI